MTLLGGVARSQLGSWGVSISHLTSNQRGKRSPNTPSTFFFFFVIFISEKPCYVSHSLQIKPYFNSFFGADG